MRFSKWRKFPVLWISLELIFRISESKQKNVQHFYSQHTSTFMFTFYFYYFCDISHLYVLQNNFTRLFIFMVWINITFIHSHPQQLRFALLLSLLFQLACLFVFTRESIHKSSSFNSRIALKKYSCLFIIFVTWLVMREKR